jgi:general secretion pathway protein B
MSYILDALRKSEEERHKSKVPTLGTQTHLIRPDQKKSALMSVLLILALLLNGIGLVYWLATKRMEGKVQTVTTPPIKQMEKSIVTQSVPPIRLIPASHSNPVMSIPLPKKNISQRATNQQIQNNSRDVSDTNPVQKIIHPKPKNKTIPPMPQVASQVVENPRVVARILPSTSTESFNKTHVELTKINANASSNSNEEDKVASEKYQSVPDISELDQDIQKTLPAFHFNSHIYSSKPSARRVMINNYYLHEGQEFSGVTLETIAPEGVVINVKGIRFHLPALNDWSYK